MPPEGMGYPPGANAQPSVPAQPTMPGEGQPQGGNAGPGGLRPQDMDVLNQELTRGAALVLLKLAPELAPLLLQTQALQGPEMASIQQQYGGGAGASGNIPQGGNAPLQQGAAPVGPTPPGPPGGGVPDPRNNLRTVA